MTRHIPDESLPEMAEGRAPEAERAHAAACASCASRLAELRSALDLARRVEVPEPPPLYWEAMRRSVGRRIGDERRARPRWVWVAPLAAAAALVVAVMLTSGRGHSPSTTPAPPPRLPAWSALPDADQDPSLVVLEGFATQDDALANVDEGGGVGPFLAGLSDEDSQVLAASLRSAVKGGAS